MSPIFCVQVISKWLKKYCESFFAMQKYREDLYYPSWYHQKTKGFPELENRRANNLDSTFLIIIRVFHGKGVNPLSTNPTIWFVGLALKGLNNMFQNGNFKKGPGYSKQIWRLKMEKFTSTYLPFHNIQYCDSSFKSFQEYQKIILKPYKTSFWKQLRFSQL